MLGRGYQQFMDDLSVYQQSSLRIFEMESSRSQPGVSLPAQQSALSTPPSPPALFEPIFSPSFASVMTEFRQMEQEFGKNMQQIDTQPSQSMLSLQTHSSQGMGLMSRQPQPSSITPLFASKEQRSQSISLQSILSLPLASTTQFSESVGEFGRIPQLTPENLVESDDIEVEMEMDSNNDLPLASVRRYQSATAENMGVAQPRGKNKVNLTLPCEEFESSGQMASSCPRCRLAEEKNEQLEGEMMDLERQIGQLKEDLCRLQERQFKTESSHSETKSNDELSSNLSLEINDPLTLSEVFLQQISETSKSLERLLRPQTEREVEFGWEERRTLQGFGASFSAFEKLYYLEEHINLKPNYTEIHEKYRKLIERINRDHHERQKRMQDEFKAAMNILVKQTEHKVTAMSACIEGKACLEGKGCSDGKCTQSKDGKEGRGRKKTKTCVEEPIDEQLIEHLRQRLQLMELNYEKEKGKVKYLQKYEKQVLQKYLQQITELTRERNAYRSAASRNVRQFQAFMAAIANKPKEIRRDDFFVSICQRVYEISNCIPFEDNDEQNLFTPETQQQVYEMLERIRRFYLGFQEYSQRKDREYQTLKRHFIIFLKELIESDKVSTRCMMELINSNRELGLEYIRDFIISLKDKPSKRESKGTSPRKIPKNTLLRIDKVESYTFKCQESEGSGKAEL